jgi:hypothetical protein
MFSKEVIEEYEDMKQKLISKGKLNTFWLSDIITNIRAAQKFHFGDSLEFYNFFHKKEDKETRIPFIDPNTKDVRLPYKTCWFDYKNNITKEQEKEFENILPSPSGSTFRPAYAKGYLLEEITKEIFTCFAFAKYNDLSSINKNKKFWDMSLVKYYIKVGGLFDEKDMENIKGIVHPKVHDALRGFVGNYDKPIIPLPIDMNLESFQKVINGDRLIADMYSMTLLEMSLCLLNCKNVITEKVDTIRIRTGKKLKNKKLGSMFSYHILNVVLPYKKKVYPDTTTVIGPKRVVRIHFVRGHPKYYTKEKPLFGKLTGRYFWPSCVKGVGDFLKKDYVVSINKSV